MNHTKETYVNWATKVISGAITASMKEHGQILVSSVAKRAACLMWAERHEFAQECLELQEMMNYDPDKTIPLQDLMEMMDEVFPGYLPCKACEGTGTTCGSASCARVWHFCRVCNGEGRVPPVEQNSPSQPEG
ncbi:MAG TPA: hypothetical protein VEI97_03400 [bacterium]|nr:hypothetical protein [bacterium]